MANSLKMLQQELFDTEGDFRVSPIENGSTNELAVRERFG